MPNFVGHILYWVATIQRIRLEPWSHLTEAPAEAKVKGKAETMETRQSGFTGSSRISPLRLTIVMASASHSKHNSTTKKITTVRKPKLGALHQEVIFLFARGINISLQRLDSISPSELRQNVLEQDNLPPTCSRSLSLWY